jgi:hypothetical protein
MQGALEFDAGTVVSEVKESWIAERAAGRAGVSLQSRVRIGAAKCRVSLDNRLAYVSTSRP